MGLLLAAAACGSGDESELNTAPYESVALPDGVSAEMAARGHRLFNQQPCFTCHGRDGTGGPLGPALNNTEWLNTDGSYDAIVAVIRAGVQQPRQFSAPMPAMGGVRLTDDQVRDLAAYVYAVSR